MGFVRSINSQFDCNFWHVWQREIQIKSLALPDESKAVEMTVDDAALGIGEYL